MYVIGLGLGLVGIFVSVGLRIAFGLAKIALLLAWRCVRLLSWVGRTAHVVRMNRRIAKRCAQVTKAQG